MTQQQVKLLNKKTVRLYRFYNMVVSQYGTPFAMCDFHKKTYREPETCVMELIANKSKLPCNLCEKK